MVTLSPKNHIWVLLCANAVWQVRGGDVWRWDTYPEPFTPANCDSNRPKGSRADLSDGLEKTWDKAATASGDLWQRMLDSAAA